MTNIFEIDKDKKVLFASLAGSFIAYHATRKLLSFIYSQKYEWIPVGVVKSLHLYPIKSGSPNDVFTFKCTKMGPVNGNEEDRSFLVVEGETRKFLTARQHPKLVKIQCSVKNNSAHILIPPSQQIEIDLSSVMKNNRTIRAILFDKLEQDGYDCGEEISEILSEYLQEKNIRLIYYQPNLFTERTSIPSPNWWNNPVPKRKDDSAFTDLAPYLIATSASLDNLNEKLEREVTHRRFRPSIFIEKTSSWDEDKWSHVKIGDVILENFAPCTRCVMTTIDPELGVMNKDMQPLKTLRKFRLAPEGKMRDEFKDSPVFGVYAGLKSAEGYIHVGQTVYAQYKKSEF